MRVGVTKETEAGERRVAVVPETVKKLAAQSLAVSVERGAGLAAGFRDEEYVAAGASLAERAETLAADIVLCVKRPGVDVIAAMQRGAALVTLLYPQGAAELVRAAVDQRLLTIALELIPRTTLAQSMDVLSSQANLAGYWAVVAAAARLPKIFPLLMTAAGTITPARVLVIGAGVAGLQAIGTAKRLGAIVEATDVRPETREQVESVGGKFLVVEGAAVTQGSGGYAAEQSDDYKTKQAQLVSQAIARADVVITTAQVPGRKAPRLVTDTQVASMRPGSVIVDLAAEQGGNVEGCESGRDVSKHGVLIIGPANTPSNVAYHASVAFSRNIEKLLLHLTKAGAWALDLSEEITAGCVVTRDGAVVHAKVREAMKG